LENDFTDFLISDFLVDVFLFSLYKDTTKMGVGLFGEMEMTVV